MAHLIRKQETNLTVDYTINMISTDILLLEIHSPAIREQQQLQQFLTVSSLFSDNKNIICYLKFVVSLTM
jgi:hypothetical protein